MTAPILSLSDVVFRYYARGKHNALDHVSLDIAEGKTTVLMGPSGCGKSTLAAVCAGLYPENGGYLECGEILLCGQPLSAMNHQQRAAYITLLFQNPDLQFCMETLRQEMCFCLENICVPPEEMPPRITQTAALLGLEPLLDRRLQTLSGGEKQKAALACLVLLDSRCLVLDEAFANLDADAIRQILPLLARQKSRGKTILAIDHRLDFWLDLADEIILLGQGGRVIQRGITRQNLSEFAPLFAQQGLFFPHCGSVKANPATGAAAVSFRDVSICAPGAKRKEPGRPLLVQANAEFPARCITAVLGPSGSGKTTAFLSLLRQHPYTGTITVGGQDLASLRPKALVRQIGMVFQNPGNQFITQNVEDEIKSSLRIWEKGLTEAACQEKAQQILEEFGLAPYRRVSPYMLSQGQQRRLAVLAVLAGGQQILLLDEPTYGQDFRSTQAIMTLLARKVAQDGLTVILITHDRALAAGWADRIYRLENRNLLPVCPEELRQKGGAPCCWND